MAVSNGSTYQPFDGKDEETRFYVRVGGAWVGIVLYANSIGLVDGLRLHSPSSRDPVAAGRSINWTTEQLDWDETMANIFIDYRHRDHVSWTGHPIERLPCITVALQPETITEKLAPTFHSALHLVKDAFLVGRPTRGRICFSVSLLVVMVLSITGTMSVAFAKNDDCDPSLEQPSENPYGYRQRGDRCEGQYVKQVASTTLFIASFTETFGEVDHNSNKDLVVEWKALGHKETRLRAHGLKRKLYYRMDTVRSPEVQKFNWPVGLLAALTIPRQNIGVVGWTHYSIGGVEKEVYLPLQINQTKANR